MRLGVEEIRAASIFVFRNDPDNLNRYPGVHISRKRRRTDDSTQEESETSVEAEESSQDAPIDDEQPIEVESATSPIVSEAPAV